MPDWKCLCGEIATGNVCDVCGHDPQHQSPARAPATVKRCAECNFVARIWPELTQGEDMIRRCASCHLAYLGRRASGDPTERCTEPGCDKTAADHIAEAKAIIPRVFTRLTGVARLPALELDRPAAAWSPQERMTRADQELARYREHLAQEAS